MKTSTLWIINTLLVAGKEGQVFLLGQRALKMHFAAKKAYRKPVTIAMKAKARSEGMPTIHVSDGVDLYFKDWGAGPALMFCHGWPLSADAWDAQMLFFLNHGYRVIAHDRRSHGRSTQVAINNNMNAYADDLAVLLDHLRLQDVVLIGHSTGGGEVARYIGRHGTSRVSKAVLMGAVPPVMLRSDVNPAGSPRSVFDEIRSQFVADRSQYFRDLTAAFYGSNRDGARVSQGIQEHFWLQGMLGGIKGQYDCIEQFSETDFTDDLLQFDIPTLLMHGDADQIVPIAASSNLSAKLIPGSRLKIYPGFPHGMAETHADIINHDILEFLKS